MILENERGENDCIFLWSVNMYVMSLVKRSKFMCLAKKTGISFKIKNEKVFTYYSLTGLNYFLISLYSTQKKSGLNLVISSKKFFFFGKNRSGLLTYHHCIKWIAMDKLSNLFVTFFFVATESVDCVVSLYSETFSYN